MAEAMRPCVRSSFVLGTLYGETKIGSTGACDALSGAFRALFG
jgi:hypothetical protein